MGNGRHSTLKSGTHIPSAMQPRDVSGNVAEQMKNLTFEKFINTRVDTSSNMEYDYATEAETVEFFKQNSNAYDIINKMNYEDRNAFLTWATGHFMSGDHWGRDFSQLSMYDQDLIRKYDKHIDKATIDKSIVVTRRTTEVFFSKLGVRNPTDINKHVGKQFDVDYNMSFGAATQGLNIHQTKNLDIHLHIPEGSTGAGMWIGDRSVHGWGARQREVMTNRNIVLEVGPAKYNKSTGYWDVDVYYVGRKKHSYN